MESQIGVNQLPVSTEAMCDVCGEPQPFCGPVEMNGGEWVCVNCDAAISNHECPECGDYDAGLALDGKHTCDGCFAMQGIDADADDRAGWMGYSS